MTKIGLFHIVQAHLDTLRDEGQARISRIDIIVFFIAPMIAASLAAYFICVIPKEVFVIIISVFSIFSALLINAQVAIFGISQKERPSLDDKQKEEILVEEFKMRNRLLSQLNTNISYLIVIACFSLVIFIAFYAFEWSSRIEIFIAVYVFLHFLTSLMMVIKRSHALFQREYDRNR